MTPKGIPHRTFINIWKPQLAPIKIFLKASGTEPIKIFLMGQPQPLFHLSLSFQTHIEIFTTNKCEKMFIQ